MRQGTKQAIKATTFACFKFLLNGCGLGVIGWAIQKFTFDALGGSGSAAYAIASLLTYTVLIGVNFKIQGTLIFRDDGRFNRFILANVLVMLLVSALSPICWTLVAPFTGATTGKDFGFALAALLGAVPSFLLSRYFVFRSESKITRIKKCESQ